MVIADDYDDLGYMTCKLFEELDNWGLKINLDKTKYMAVGEKMKDLNLPELGKAIQGCEEFKYLGSKITLNGRQTKEMMERIAKGRSTISMLNGILWDRHIKKETKINIYKTIVRSVLTYGTETWILNKKIKSKLASTEMDFLRSSRHSKLEKVWNIEIRRQMNYLVSIIDCF